MNIKNVILSFLAKYTRELARYSKEPSNELNVLRMAVHDRLARDSEPFFFVQIGANDGCRADPIRSIVLRHHLSGLLVEPLPDMFESLQQNYADCPNVLFENAAIGKTAGTLALTRVKADAKVPDSMHGMATFDENKLSKIVKKLGAGDCLENVDVPMLKFADLADKYSFEKIDLLVIDTEGYDLVVLESVFDAGFKPVIINIEVVGLSYDDRLKTKSLLTNMGYRFTDAGDDVVAALFPLYSDGSPSDYSILNR